MTPTSLLRALGKGKPSAPEGLRDPGTERENLPARNACRCENFRQALAPHGLHRNTVGEAVALVGTAGIEIEPGPKRFMTLRNDAHGVIGKQLAHGLHSAVSKPAIPGKERQQPGQNFFGRGDVASGKKIIETQGHFGMQVAPIR